MFMCVQGFGRTMQVVVQASARGLVIAVTKYGKRETMVYMLACASDCSKRHNALCKR